MLIAAGCVMFITAYVAERYERAWINDEEEFDMLKLDDKVYDILKWIAIVALPALSTFIVVISKIWGWGDVGSMVAQTITAVAVLLGALLGISTIQYNKSES